MIKDGGHGARPGTDLDADLDTEPGAMSPVDSGSVPAPFQDETDREWESELAAWDAAIPIVSPAPVSFDTSTRAEDEPPDDVIPVGAFDDGTNVASGSYAALTATEAAGPGADPLFDSAPPDEPRPTFPEADLPVMEPAAWRGDLASLISLPPQGAAWTAPDAGYWETLARVIGDEASREHDPGRRVSLGLAAARVSDSLRRPHQALEQLDEVLTIEPTSVAAHRARLLLSEAAGRMDESSAVDSLARLARMAHPDQAYYRALRTEWMVVRAGQGLADPAAAAAMVAVVPAGLGRLLAEAELAWREPAHAAAILEAAANRVGGGLGAALLVCAACLNEVARDFAAAAEQRFLAARLDDRRTPAAVGLIRDLARLDARAVVPALEYVLAQFPPSALKAGLARWGAAAARQLGDHERAWQFLADPDRLDTGPPSAALVRDRFDLWIGGDPTLTDDVLASVLSAWSSHSARVCVVLRACELANDEGTAVPAGGGVGVGVADALALVEQAIDAGSDVAALGPAAEWLAAHASDGPTRCRALEMWRRTDRARWASASFEWAEALAALPEGISANGPLEASRSTTPRAASEAVLRDIEAAAVTTTVFWHLAASAAHQGDRAAATAHLDGALARPPWAEEWAAAPLAELAAERMADRDVQDSVSRLEVWRTKGGAASDTRLTRERALRRLGDRDLWAWHVEQELATSAATPLDRRRRAALLLEPIFWRSSVSVDAAGAAAADDDDAVAPLVSSTLDLVPLEPTALALMMASGPEPARLIERFLDGAGASVAPRRWRSIAASAAGAVAATTEGLRAALSVALPAWHALQDERAADDGSGPAAVSRSQREAAAASAAAAAALIRRASVVVDDVRYRATLLSDLAVPGCAADVALEAAEAAESIGDQPSVRRLLAMAAAAPGAAAVTADIHGGLSRLPGGGLSLEAASPGDRLTALDEFMRGDRWDDVVNLLGGAPPHEATAGSRLLSLAALIDEGRAGAKRAAKLWSDARAALDREERQETIAGHESSGSADERPAWRQAADPLDGDPVEVAAAEDRLAAVAAAVADNRSAALYAWDAAHRGGLLVSAASTEARLLTAVAHDPLSVPANVAWRRWLVHAGRLIDAATAAIAEADAFVDPSLRVDALLRAAAMLASSSSSSSSSSSPSLNDWVPRAAACLRRALEIIPNHQDAFTRLRDLYESNGRYTELVDLLAARLQVTTNPFESTALRLARADVFAGPLRDRARAKAELEAILQKEPQQARVLGLLADLEEEDGNAAAAAELLLRRAFVERSPDELRELFLRVGRIYTKRLPDATRAVTAFSRVLQLDPEHREALDELAMLYLEVGDAKGAASITERLVRIENNPARRARYNVRLGQLAEHGGDSLAAAGYFQRAVGDAPYDIEALGELVRHLDRARDVMGRRALLDRSASELRAAILKAPLDVGLLRVFVAVSRWRGRNATAAAAAELLAAAGAGGGSGVFVPVPAPAARDDDAYPELTTRSRRSLAALNHPVVDEQTFGPAVPSSVRHLFRVLGPLLWEGRPSALSSYGVERGHRVSGGRSPRDVLDVVAKELSAGPFDVYVVPASARGGRVPLIVEPGKPTAVVIGAPLVQLGPAAIDFIAGRVLRLTSTHLDLAVAGRELDLGAWLGGVIRQFVVEYAHPDVPGEIIAARAARVARLLPRRMRQEVMPFALESSGTLDLPALRAGIIDGANRVGLVGSASVVAALTVILAISGAGLATLSGEGITRNPEAIALLTFALSDEHDDLVRSLESQSAP